MKKLKVLQVNKMYYPVIGGVEKVVQQIAEGLKEQTDMEVLVCNQKGRSSDERINHVRVIRTSSLGVYFSMPVSVSFLFKLRKMAGEKDILLFHMPFPLGDLAGLLSGYKGKVVVWWHSDIVKQKKLLKLYEPLMKRFLKRADKIIVATEGHIEHSAYLGAFKEKCVVIPYGVDASITEDSRRYTQETKDSKEVTFLFVGRLVYYKGCEVLLRAFSKLNRGRLILAGSGPLKEDLLKITKEAGIADKVIFVEKPSDEKLKELYKECDVFVLPSVEKTEAFGLVQIEAMSYGKPVINTRLKSGVPYVGKDGVTGITVEPKDSEALYLAMKKLAENSELRLEMGRNAYSMVQEKYLMQNMLNQTLDLLEEVVFNDNI